MKYFIYTQHNSIKRFFALALMMTIGLGGLACTQDTAEDTTATNTAADSTTENNQPAAVNNTADSATQPAIAPNTNTTGDDPRIKSNKPHVLVTTDKGEIVIELFEDEAPLSTANFIEYADAGYYNGTIFHRVISSFMIQGGGFTANLEQKTTRDPIKNEANNQLSNKRGTVAMARTSDPNSATSQFYINVVDNAQLNFRAETSSGWGYAVFGRVVAGMDVVDRIRKVPTTFKKGMGNVPVDTVTITDVKVLQR